MRDSFEAVIVGGGFYGAAIAVYLVEKRGLRDVLLVERESELLQRASYNNQARIHNGYHYPRSFTTAFRSRINLPRFLQAWPDSARTDFVKLYAIARRNSKVTARQFERFCTEIGASLEPAEAPFQTLFNHQLVEAVYRAQEYVFDASKLERWAGDALAQHGVQVRLRTRAKAVSRCGETGLSVTLEGPQGETSEVTAQTVFNCTYSGLNQLAGQFPGTNTPLKQEITEMALVEPPAILQDVGITLMDGPFFSIMPFPARGLHTLSHVRYTPHTQWPDAAGTDPYQALADYDRQTRGDRMVRDASRYVPAIREARQVDSLFEVKTVLVKNEGDDGRPILFERHSELPGCYSILGGKIDNIFDILEKLDAEPLTAMASLAHHGGDPLV